MGQRRGMFPAMRHCWRLLALIFLAVTMPGCRASLPAATPARGEATLAQVYYWKARPGMLDAYNAYIIAVAEPIDADAHRRGAFVSVTTYQSSDTLSPWTHMRVFLLRDSVQLRGLSTALDEAGRRLEPDSVKRRVRGEYGATLRDRVGSALLTIVH